MNRALPTVRRGDDFDRFRLARKLSLPRHPADAVSRARLIHGARSIGEHRVVGITAPAGYGKSTLLAEWASTEDRPVAFVSFDRFDDDPATLLELLAAAWERIDPQGGDPVVDTGPAGPSVLSRAAPRLAAILGSSRTPFVLMLDDLHELQSPSCHDVLSIIVDGIPAGSQLVTASRAAQPHLPRLRVSGDSIEIVAADLALGPTGAQAIFSAQHLSLTPEMASEVTTRTEGWPAGLYLAAVIRKEGDDRRDLITGDDPYVADYLYREALRHQPEDLQRFLRRTAVLDHLCASLCDGVVGLPGGSEHLRRLERSNLFVVPLDRRREWYRYHALFREFLLGELRREEPETIEKLHLRAADWYEANGAEKVAVEHLLSTGERDRTVQLLARLILDTYQMGDVSTTRRWLSAVGQEHIERYPPLAVYAALDGVWSGDPFLAERWRSFVDETTFTMAPTAAFSSYESGRAVLRAGMCADGAEQVLHDATFAVSREPPWSAWRYRALWALAEGHLLKGDTGHAVSCLTEICTTAVDHGQFDVLVLAESHLGRLAMDCGDWQEGAERLDRALTTISEHRTQDYVTSVLAYSGTARLLLHRGDPDRTHQYLVRAMRARPIATYALPQVAVRLRTELGQLYLALDDPTTSRQLLREIDDILIHRPALGVLVDEVETLRRSLAATSAGTSPGPLTPAELRLLPYLQTHLTLGDIAGRLFVSRSTVNSQVTSIYRKLRVSSRRDAVSRATTKGLLGG